MLARSVSALVLAGALVFALAMPADATVSILAVDPVTGQVGVAGASCLQTDLAQIATVLPGVGVAVSQGHQRGEDPQRLLDAMRQRHGALGALDRVASARPHGGAPERQFAVVMLGGGGAATLTGHAADPVAAETSAGTVAVVGTDLLSRDAVDRAKQAFLAASGDLAQRLIAGLRAAGASGGDRRCHSQTATAAFIIVASRGENPVVPIRGLPDVARRRRHVLNEVGKTVAADELGDLLRDAAGLRRPTGPGHPDLYLSLMQPAHGFNAVALLAKAYRQLLSSPPSTSSLSPTSIPSPSPAGHSARSGGGLSAPSVIAIGGLVVLVGFWSRSRRRRRRARAARAAARTKT